MGSPVQQITPCHHRSLRSLRLDGLDETDLKKALYIHATDTIGLVAVAYPCTKNHRSSHYPSRILFNFSRSETNLWSEL